MIRIVSISLARPIRKACPFTARNFCDILTAKAPRDAQSLIVWRVIGDSARVILKHKRRNLNKTWGDYDDSSLLRR